MSRKKPTPNAIATKFGWADPVTGELLVSMKGLIPEINDYKPNRPISTKPLRIKEIIIPEENTQEELDNLIPEEIKPAQKRTRRTKIKV
jgi:hypothetical protein